MCVTFSLHTGATELETSLEDLLFHLACSEQAARQVLAQLRKEDHPPIHKEDARGLAWQLGWLSAFITPVMASESRKSVKDRCAEVGVAFPVS